MNGRFFADAIKHAVASRAIVELACGASKYYLHREVAADLFGFDQATAADTMEPVEAKTSTKAPLSLEDLLPVYRRLKAEQGGFSAVKIFRFDESAEPAERGSPSPAGRRGQSGSSVAWP